MLRSTLLRAGLITRPLLVKKNFKPIPVVIQRFRSTSQPTQIKEAEEVHAVKHFEEVTALDDQGTKDLIDQLISSRNTPICGYETRRYFQFVHALDCVPEPILISEFMESCRACNDIALAIRILESIKRKCGKHKNILWPYITQEIRPTLDKLGIPLPEDLGYDKPELWLDDVFDIH
jgi:hypothetical protein